MVTKPPESGIWAYTSPWFDTGVNPTIGINVTLQDGLVINLRSDVDTLLLTQRPSLLRRLVLYAQGWRFSHAAPRNPLL